MIDRLLPYVLLPLLGALGFYVSPFYGGEPSFPYSEVVVPARVIEESEPDTVVSWRERIVTRVVQPEVVARSEEGGEPEVESFCAEFARAKVDSATAAGGDTVETVSTRPARRLLLRSGSHDPGWFWRSDHLTLTGPLSDGGLQQQSYTLRPGFSFRTHADSVIVRSPRWWWVREGAEAGVLLGIGYALGKAF